MIVFMIAAATANAPVCAKLTNDYEMASKRLSYNFSLVGQQSDARRDANEANILSQSRITLDLLKANHCKIPTTAPTAEAYLSQALQCQTDKLQSGFNSTATPPTCEMDKWKREK